MIQEQHRPAAGADVEPFLSLRLRLLKPGFVSVLGEYADQLQAQLFLVHTSTGPHIALESVENFIRVQNDRWNTFCRELFKLSAIVASAVDSGMATPTSPTPQQQTVALPQGFVSAPQQNNGSMYAQQNGSQYGSQPPQQAPQQGPRFTSPPPQAPWQQQQLYYTNQLASAPAPSPGAIPKGSVLAQFEGESLCAFKVTSSP